MTRHYIFFRQRGREGRLLRLIADTQHLDLGTSYGIGIDEDTALIITDGGGVEAKAEVIGTNGIFFTDLSQANIIINEYY